MNKSLISGAFLGLGLLALTPADAYAYVDPGTGSYLFQLAAAGLLAGMFTLRRFWDALKTWLSRAPATSSANRRPTVPTLRHAQGRPELGRGTNDMD